MFFYILFFLGITIEIVLLSTIKIEIKNLKISTEKYNGRTLNNDYKFVISIWCIQKLRLLKIEITKNKLERIKLKDRLKKQFRKIDMEALLRQFKENKKIDIKTFKKIKKNMPKITYIDLIGNIGTEDAILTSYIVATIASILGIILRKSISLYKYNKFIINPVYINKNLLNLELNCIFEIKLIHIIYIIYILNQKRRDDKNGRTSNRRTYGYSYE